MISLCSILWYQLNGTKKNPWVEVYVLSPINYSNDTATLRLTLQLCYKPLGILQRVIKVHILNESVVKVFLSLQWIKTFKLIQPSFSSIDTSWKDYNIDWKSHNGDISLKKFSSNSINFHRFKSKPSDFHHNPFMSSVTFLYP